MVYKYLSDNVSNFLERKTIFKVLPDGAKILWSNIMNLL